MLNSTHNISEAKKNAVKGWKSIVQVIEQYCAW